MHASPNDLSSADKLNRVKAWILTRAPAGQTEVALDVDLIETGLVSSVFFTEYVLVIEEIIGTEIEIDETIVDRVRTLRGVAQHFFGGG